MRELTNKYFMLFASDKLMIFTLHKRLWRRDLMPSISLRLAHVHLR